MKGFQTKRIITAALALLILVTAFPAAMAETATTGVTLELVYFRQNPSSATTPRVSGCPQIPRGATVTIIGQSGSFYQIQYNGCTGYARKQDVGVNSGTGVTIELVYFRQTPANASDPRVPGCPQIPRGAAVVIVGLSGKFYRIQYNGYTGYARVQDIAVNIGGSSSPETTPPASPPSGPDTLYDAPYVGKTKEKVYFRVYPESATTPRVSGCESISGGRTVSVLGESGNFYWIEYNGYKGYARKQDISITSGSGNSNPGSGATPMPPGTLFETPYAGKTKEKVYLRVNPSSATTPRVPGCESISGGRTVSVLGESGDFYWIEYNGYKGYARKQDISIAGGSGNSDPGSGSGGSAPVPGGADLTSEQAAEWARVPGYLSSAAASNRDTVGWIYVPGTKNINDPIMFDANYYYNDHTPARKSSSSGSIYTYYNGLSQITPIAGHNMRKSKTMFHELHHIQNRLLGKSKCESCGASVTGISRTNTVFNITLGGYTSWQLFAMYETKAKEPESTLEYNTLQPNLTGSAFDQWVQYQLSRSQLNFGVSVSGGPVVVLVTCGDNYDSATAQSRLYMFLKPVG